MKKIFFLLLLCYSCSPKSGFYTFFEDQVEVADQAIDLPKWLPMIAIPNDAKEDIKRFTKGMKRVKLLRYKYKIPAGQNDFATFKTATKLEDYLHIKNKEIDMNVMSKETEGYYKEIIITCDTRDAYYIFGMTGKMRKEDFQHAIAEAHKKNEENTDHQ